MALEMDFSKLSGTDVLDMAIAIEDEAQLYYEQLADWVKSGTNGEAADFFRRMATREERHRQQIAALQTDLNLARGVLTLQATPFVWAVCLDRGGEEVEGVEDPREQRRQGLLGSRGARLRRLAN